MQKAGHSLCAKHYAEMEGLENPMQVLELGKQVSEAE